jgi:hypothetical protein
MIESTTKEESKDGDSVNRPLLGTERVFSMPGRQLSKKKSAEQATTTTFA